MAPRGDRRWTLALLLGVLGSIGCWLAYVLGAAAPLGVARTVLALTVAAGLGRLAAWWRRRASDPDERRAAVTLLALVAAACLLRWTGLSHEVAERYYQDEGIYMNHAAAINEGTLRRPNFFYPHLLYYADAFAIWAGSLAFGPIASLSGLLTGITEPEIVARLIVRWLTATLAALVVIPVFEVGRRFGGLLAGALGGAAIAAAPVWNDGAHLHTSDVPAAVFATWVWALTARQLQEERPSRYLGAGALVGIAAGTKYNASLAAVAVAAAWLSNRWRTRRLGGRDVGVLVGAGLLSIAVFLATTPSLLFDPVTAIFGPRGVLLGPRQYSRRGWLGVLTDSNLQYYATFVVRTFGWPLLALGVAGWLAARRPLRTTVGWLLVYPVVYLALICSMNMVVERNLYPALPPLAALLGLGAADLARRLGERRPRQRRVVLAVAAGLVLAHPVVAGTLDSVAYARPSTRDLASAWAHRHLPIGAHVFREAQTPGLYAKLYRIGRIRFAAYRSLEELREGDADVLVLSEAAFARYLADDAHFEDYHATMAERYRTFLALPSLARFAPSRLRRGPVVEILEIPPLHLDGGPSVLLAPVAAFALEVPPPPLPPAGRAEVPLDPRLTAYRAALEEGPWRVAPRRDQVGFVRILDVRGGLLGEGPLRDGPRFRVQDPGRIYVHLTRPGGERPLHVLLRRLPDRRGTGPS